MFRKFRSPAAFKKSQPYQLLPFQFTDLSGKKLLVNVAGEHALVEEADFAQLVSYELQDHSAAYLTLKSRHFLSDTQTSTAIRLLSTKLRTKYGFLAGFTQLHIFVVSLRCDHSCHYCQVSRVTATKSKFDMSQETADRALDCVFRTPSQTIKIEFQGGESLLNFDLIRYIVFEAERKNLALGDQQKYLEFVVATNLSTINDEMLAFFEEHSVYVSTSLDGPAFLHNANRPTAGSDSHAKTIRGIARIREAMGHEAVSAVMTTTRLSLRYPREIVQEYVDQGFSHIFLRPISPYGFALKTAPKTGYDRSAFLDFYKAALDHVISVNRNGGYMVEAYAQILLRKILTPFATGYVDLQSPSGAVLGAVVYNYDGDVYASDESRMLAEMGDKSFRLGSVHSDSYETLFGGHLARSLVASSINQSLPGCADCAFQVYCGADPIENHATQGSLISHRADSDFCRRNMGIISHLFEQLYFGEEYSRWLFHAWAQNRDARELYPAFGGSIG